MPASTPVTLTARNLRPLCWEPSASSHRSVRVKSVLPASMAAASPTSSRSTRNGRRRLPRLISASRSPPGRYKRVSAGDDKSVNTSSATFPPVMATASRVPRKTIVSPASATTTFPAGAEYVSAPLASAIRNLRPGIHSLKGTGLSLPENSPSCDPSAFCFPTSL